MPTTLASCACPRAQERLAASRACAGTPPFDRHDWYLDRCGRQVRYVIDFYFDEQRAGSPEAFTVDARPALDSPGALLDRAKMGVREARGALLRASVQASRVLTLNARLQIYVWCLRLGLPCPFSKAPTVLADKPA